MHNQQGAEDWPIYSLEDRRSNAFIRSRQRENIDRRNAFRIGLDSPTFFYEGNERISGIFKDISDSGAQVELEHMIDQQCATLEIDLPLLRNKKTLCEISWNKKSESSSNGNRLYGIKFLELTFPEKRDLRKRFLLNKTLILSFAQEAMAQTYDLQIRKKIKSFFLEDVRTTIEKLIDIDRDSTKDNLEKTRTNCRITFDNVIHAQDQLALLLNNESLSNFITFQAGTLLGKFIYQSTNLKNSLKQQDNLQNDGNLLELLYIGFGQVIYEQNNSWEDHYKQYCNPNVTTHYLRKAVPLLEFSDWRVEKIKEGFCQSIIPFSKKSKNQHTTQQSAMFCLSADYTGGIALYGLLKGVPTFGVHPVDKEWGLNLWLLKSNLKFIQPSTGELRVTAEVSEDRFHQITKRFFNRKRVIETVEVKVESNGKIVGKGTMTYFLQMLKYSEWLKMK